jgi:hypothetical protein
MFGNRLLPSVAAIALLLACLWSPAGVAARMQKSRICEEKPHPTTTQMQARVGSPLLSSVYPRHLSPPPDGPKIGEVIGIPLGSTASVLRSDALRSATGSLRTISRPTSCSARAKVMSRTAFSASSECVSVFDLISTPLGVKMSRKLSLFQSPLSVELVLTGNSESNYGITLAVGVATIVLKLSPASSPSA